MNLCFPAGWRSVPLNTGQVEDHQTIVKTELSVYFRTGTVIPAFWLDEVARLALFYLSQFCWQKNSFIGIIHVEDILFFHWVTYLRLTRAYWSTETRWWLFMTNLTHISGEKHTDKTQAKKRPTENRKTCWNHLCREPNLKLEIYWIHKTSQLSVDWTSQPGFTHSGQQTFQQSRKGFCLVDLGSQFSSDNWKRGTSNVHTGQTLGQAIPLFMRGDMCALAFTSSASSAEIRVSAFPEIQTVWVLAFSADLQDWGIRFWQQDVPGLDLQQFHGGEHCFSAWINQSVHVHVQWTIQGSSYTGQGHSFLPGFSFDFKFRFSFVFSGGILICSIWHFDCNRELGDGVCCDCLRINEDSISIADDAVKNAWISMKWPFCGLLGLSAESGAAYFWVITLSTLSNVVVVVMIPWQDPVSLSSQLLSIAGQPRRW